MAKTYKAACPQSLQLASATCTAAKTTYNDSANAVLLFTAGTEGSEILRLWALPRATVTATQLQLYWSPDSGTTIHLLDSELMAAHTMAQTTAAPETQFSNISPTTPVPVPAGAKVYVAIGVALAGGITFTAQYRDY